VSEPVTLNVLLGTATSIAVLHTLIGVDHTLPFIALGRARNWSLSRVLMVTAACGVGHVLSSVVLGILALAFGRALFELKWLEAQRGSLASVLLIAFGAFFAVRALVRSLRGKTHSHSHVHADGVVHEHPHHHAHAAHVHPHAAPDARSTTVWTLFIIFVLGPCEPLVPLMLAPATLAHTSWVVLVVVVFSAATIAVMLAVVSLGYLGLARISQPFIERHAELFAGLAIAACGVAIRTLGI
jgi:ABC-type nickel/cobalt efflux system permease component RcnA